LATTLLPSQSLEDLHVAEGVGRALCATGYPALRTIEVSVCSGQAVLRGRIRSYYMKQVAQAVALAVPGVVGLCNELEVV
jgi:osmotically-inducible protein OsmY